MKKVVVFLALIIVLSFFSETISAGVKIKPKLLTTEAIDAVWEKTNFITNYLPAQDQEKRYGQGEAAGRLNFFFGKTEWSDIRMALVELPMFMGSQITSIQLIVNGSQGFTPSLKLSHQVYDHAPKLINRNIVLRCYVGVINREESHFYIVFDSNGYGYETEVISAK